MFRLLIALLLGWASVSRAVGPPVIPVGLDAYRQWDRWPYQRIGARTYMRSTYDRQGGNEGADASHFLYQLAEDRNVTLDVQGPGILYFTRYNHWHGSPWHYEVDGRDYLVQETSTSTPNHPVPNSTFLPERAFPWPLAFTWAQTQGADLSWVPIPFRNSLRLAYSRTHYGTGYYIYQQFVPGTKLSRRLGSWSENTRPDRAVLDLLARSGSDLVPPVDSRAGRKLGLKHLDGELVLEPGGSAQVADLHAAPAMLRVLQFCVPRAQALAFGRCRLRIFWDGASLPAVDSPVALFFGAGTLYNRDHREYLVKAFPVSIRFEPERAALACYFPMPFFQSARIELVNPTNASVVVNWALRFARLKAAPGQVGYFHATYRDHPQPPPGQDLVLLDTRQTEGGGDWSGQLVGTSFIFSDRAVLSTLEGDPRFFFDDSQTPQAYGTGTEEWGGGGDYWGGRNMSLPFAGHPTGAPNLREARCDEDKIESAYRYLLADLMPFGKNALIRLEHGGRDESKEHYQTVTYWYGIHHASLVQTDELKIGEPGSEQSHQYLSPEAGAPYSLTSRYELGVDHLNGREIYPAQTDVGRSTRGTSEFNLKLRPDNLGVLLRRKLDYQFPNQRAEVCVAPVLAGGRVGKFRAAGAWYLAGSSTCVYSNPKDELGRAQHIIEASNRRFRDDGFLLSRRLTRGQSEIRVRIKFTPVAIPLFPGQALPEFAWSEFRYDAYCFVMPR
jgi:D-arabinan exo alpha-(1,3)/(1,5)-arabinofuranosidase (non-reducing end)